MRFVRALRTLVLLLALGLLLGGLGLFAWASRNPEAAWLEEAESWPWVGSAVEAFREKWLPPSARGAGPVAPASPADGSETGEPDRPSSASSAPSESPEVVVIRREPQVVGATEQEWVEPGMELRAGPSEEAELVERFDLYANLTVLSREGEWVKLKHQGRAGWVRIPERTEPLLGSAPAPNLPLPGRPPEPERLARARELLGVDGPKGTLGPYTLFTDVDSERLLTLLAGVAESVEAAYRNRYGRTPVGEAKEAVMLFRDQKLYRQFQAGERELVGLPATGHAGYGLAALYVRGRGDAAVAATLAHELAHLLNRRALGPALPPWLDEGIAGDLGGGAIGPAGRLIPNRLGGASQAAEGRIEYSGSLAAALQLRRQVTSGSLIRLERLTALDWERFVRGIGPESNHAHSALFVRYLLDGEQGALAPGFRAYLASISEGGPATPEALLQHLDRDWRRLEAGFRAWVTLAAGVL